MLFIKYVRQMSTSLNYTYLSNTQPLLIVFNFVHGYSGVIMSLPKNVFYDINQFPKDWGIIIFPISMSRISNSQNAKTVIDTLKFFSPKKISKPVIGVNVLYTDYLYLYSDEPSNALKTTYTNLTISHKNSLTKLIQKNWQKMQITDAFNFSSWNQYYLQTNNFVDLLNKIYDLYKEDQRFKSYIEEDCNHFRKPLNNNQISFFLEEHLMTYLMIFTQIDLPNNYVKNREKWVLISYSGTPEKALIYLIQQNPFNLKTDNPYIGQYDLEQKKFYDFTRLDLETWNYD